MSTPSGTKQLLEPWNQIGQHPHCVLFHLLFITVTTENPASVGDAITSRKQHELNVEIVSYPE